LVAYYTLGSPGGATPRDPPDPGGKPFPPDPLGLRSFLRARLPGYMIPAAFVPLDQMPLTPEGEPARGTLGHPPVPAPGAGPGGQRTPTQAGMTYLWSRLLKKDQVGLDDDFFALGGNSLLAAEMLARTRVMFGIGADYVRPLTRCLLRDPTLRGFAQATQDARAGRLAADGAQGRYDLGGAAGLAACGGAAGLAACGGAAGLAACGGGPGDRVVPLPGDLAAPRLGLSPGEFRELARSTDIIYHAGAIVNFIYPNEELRAANVTGTREVIRLAGLVR